MNYEQKYKEALEKARQFSEHPLQEDSSSIVEYIFPELQEIEDEKIRKWLIDWAKAVKWSKKFTISKKQLLAWLEKPGNPNPYSGISFKHNGHTWGMCARDCGVDLMYDGKLRASFNEDGDVF